MQSYDQLEEEIMDLLSNQQHQLCIEKCNEFIKYLKKDNSETNKISHYFWYSYYKMSTAYLNLGNIKKFREFANKSKQYCQNDDEVIGTMWHMAYYYGKYDKTKANYYYDYCLNYYFRQLDREGNNTKLKINIADILNNKVYLYIIFNLEDNDDIQLIEDMALECINLYSEANAPTNILDYAYHTLASLYIKYNLKSPFKIEQVIHKIKNSDKRNSIKEEMFKHLKIA